MPNLNAQLVGASLQVIDNTNSVLRVNSALGILLFAGTSAVYDSYLELGTVATNLVLPATTIQVLFIKNNHASQTVTVTATPAGGASATIGLIQPGGVFLYLNPGTSAGGYTAVSLTASGASTPVELLMAG